MEKHGIGMGRSDCYMNKNKCLFTSLFLSICLVFGTACEGSGGYDRHFVIDGAVPLDAAKSDEPETVVWSIGDRAVMREYYGIGAGAVIIKPIYPVNLETHQIDWKKPCHLVINNGFIIGYWTGLSERECYLGKTEYYEKTTRLLKEHAQTEYLLARCRNGLFLISPENEILPFTSYGYDRQKVSDQNLLYDNNYAAEAVISGEIFLPENYAYIME